MKNNCKQALRAMLDFDDEGKLPSTLDIAKAMVGEDEPTKVQINRAYAALDNLHYRGYLSSVTHEDGIRRWGLK